MHLNHVSGGGGESGFTAFELTLVIVILGLLSAAALQYYLELREEALRTGLQVQAHNFATAVYGARAAWLVKRHSGAIPLIEPGKSYVDLESTRIYLNEMGWPANTSIELDSSANSQTPAECYELWHYLMANPQPATVDGLISIGGHQGDQRYHVSAGSNFCHYELVQKSSNRYYFDYDLNTGKVLINYSR